MRVIFFCGIYVKFCPEISLQAITFKKKTGYIYLQENIHPLEGLHTWVHDVFC